MCLILFAHQCDPRYHLVIAANRDEFYARPTERSHWWGESPDLLAGKDLQAGGSWMGVSESGHFAALTNFRDPTGIKPNAPSRGDLVTGFLRSADSPETYLNELLPKVDQFNGYNLLLGKGEQLLWQSNEATGWAEVDPGVHGLSNHLLDTPWPKVDKGRAGLTSWVAEQGETEALFSLLSNPVLAPDDQLPQTGVSLEWERKLSPMYIESSTYGTRVSTVILFSKTGQIYWEERAYVPAGEARIFEFTPTSAKIT
jgi:uncharacterized protein with NRDE domain